MGVQRKDLPECLPVSLKSCQSGGPARSYHQLEIYGPPVSLLYLSIIVEASLTFRKTRCWITSVQCVMKQIVEIKEAQIIPLLSLRFKKKKASIKSSALRWELQVKKKERQRNFALQISSQAQSTAGHVCTWLSAWALVPHSLILKLTITDYCNHWWFLEFFGWHVISHSSGYKLWRASSISLLMLCLITYHICLEPLGLGKNSWYWCILKHLVTGSIHLSCSPYLSNSNCFPLISQN